MIPTIFTENHTEELRTIDRHNTNEQIVSFYDCINEGSIQTHRINHIRKAIYGLMCPICYNVIYRSISISQSAYVETIVDENHTEPDDCDVTNYVSDPTYYLNKCKSCLVKDIKLIPLDFHIAEAISIFNKKGFETEYSCEGHDNIDMEERCDGYVMFKNSRILDYIHLLSPTWYIDHDSDTAMQKLNHRLYGGHAHITIIRASFDDYAESLSDLLDFAKSLPAITTTYHVDKHHDMILITKNENPGREENI